MKYSMRAFFPVQGDLITLPDALEKQLGLKLEIVKEPMPVLVVDSVNQKPSPDPPGAEEALKTAASPTEFEVADVKPSNPDSRGMRFQIQPGGRVNFTGMTLKSLIQQAWSISEDMIVGAPKWLDSDRFDIIAKAPSAAQTADSSAGPANATVDIDTVWIMFRALLKERFKMEFHNEERPVSAYTLLAVNPKIKKADPTSRTGLVEEPANDSKNGNVPTHVFSVQNMTMAQFAAQLRRVAPAVIRVPVLDSTGLEGSYSFTLTFTGAGMALPAGVVRSGGMNGMDAGPASDASDPTGIITLPQAIEKLGLKLELQKRPMSVLVIDRIERTPTEN